MAGINLVTVMDALATAFASVTGVSRSFGYPNEDARPGDALVGYPTDIDLAVTFGRGMDHAVFPVLVICGLSSDATTRQTASDMLLGSSDVLDLVDNSVSGASTFVRAAHIQRVELQGNQYLAVQYDVDVTI